MVSSGSEILCGLRGGGFRAKKMARISGPRQESQKVCQLDGARFGWLAAPANFCWGIRAGGLAKGASLTEKTMARKIPRQMSFRRYLDYTVEVLFVEGRPEDFAAAPRKKNGEDKRSSPKSLRRYAH